jgi:Zn-dependent protease with chaperone function
MCAYLQREESEIWHWYASSKFRDEQAESVQFDLLKSTYRVERSAQPDLYARVEDVARRLELDVPVTIYQSQNPLGLNASLAYVPSEAHIVLHGPVASKLTEAEFRALLAHELSHFLLWRSWEGRFMVAEQILAAMTHDPLADTPHFASARLFALYNEIFCDRGALLVSGSRCY